MATKSTLYRRRIDAGLCGMCGKPRGETHSTCATCTEKARVKKAERTAKYSKQGLCPNCGRELAPGAAKCAVCLEAARRYANQEAARRREAGLCTSCGNRPPMSRCVVCKPCSDSMAARTKAKYKARRAAGLCGLCGRPRAPGNKSLCEYHVQYEREYRAGLKRDAMNAYGGPVCVGCGCDEIEILEIDHIDGGGNKHRKEVSCGASGKPFYQWLRENGYPPGFRVLCPNCNKRAYRGIPFPNDVASCATS